MAPAVLGPSSHTKAPTLHDTGITQPCSALRSQRPHAAREVGASAFEDPNTEHFVLSLEMVTRSGHGVLLKVGSRF